MAEEMEAVAMVSERLLEMGCYEVSLGDTIGVGTPGSVRAMLREVKEAVPVEQLAIHTHDTYGMACANILASLAEVGACQHLSGTTARVCGGSRLGTARLGTRVAIREREETVVRRRRPRFLPPIDLSRATHLAGSQRG